MPKLHLVTVLLLAACTTGSTWSADEPAPANGGLPATYQGLPLLWIPKRPAPKELKGDLSAPEWKDAARVPMGLLADGAEPKNKTEAYALCTDDALYIAFRCGDAAPDDLKTNGTQVWQNDEVEVFIEPDRTTLEKPYHQFIVDARGQQSAQRAHIYPKYGSAAVRAKTAFNPKIETAIGKGQDYWSVEIRIPFDQLVLSEAAEKKDTLWRLNLYRHRPEREKEPMEEMAWSPTGNDQFHAAAKFGYMLPETHATKALLERVKQEAAAWQPKKLSNEADPSIVYEINKRIGELAAENFGERDQAAERLKGIADEGPGNYKALLQALADAVERSRDVQVVAAAKKLLEQIKAEEGLRNDDDPPPDHIRRGFITKK